MKINQQRMRISRFASIGIAVLGIGLLSACDFSVTNPGPIQDEFLDDPQGLGALVAGMNRAHSRALTFFTTHAGVVAKELTPSGFVGTDPLGTSTQMRQGILVPQEVNPHWQAAHSARWVAEDGIRRMRRVLPESQFASSALVARAYLFAGYANRLLGENMCDAVIDGSGAAPVALHFARADSAFTVAITIASAANQPTTETAALAGRASVRASLGRWEDAIADANRVPTAFQFQAPYYVTETEQFNFVAHGSSVQWRTYSVWGTYYATYYTATRDARTPWNQQPDRPFGSGVGDIPWYFQTKYPAINSPVNISSGREMRLLEAEALLRNGQWQQATEIVNQIRTSAGMEAWSVSGLEEAWTALQRERGIELWLEGRRLGDIHRWLSDSSNPRGGIDDMTGRSTCFPISQIERDSNPNL